MQYERINHKYVAGFIERPRNGLDKCDCEIHDDVGSMRECGREYQVQGYELKV
jgi:hypothetical protein